MENNARGGAENGWLMKLSTPKLRRQIVTDAKIVINDVARLYVKTMVCRVAINSRLAKSK